MAEATVRVHFAEKLKIADDPPGKEGAANTRKGDSAAPAKGGSRQNIMDLASGDSDAPVTIHEAAERGLHKDIIRMVERTLDFEIDQRDRYGRTALMWAAEQGHRETAETLVDLGADRRATDPQTGRNAIHLAARAGNADMLAALLDDMDKAVRTEMVNEPDKNGITPVFLAKLRGDDGLAAFEYLMSNGARYNQQAWKEMGELPPMPPVPKTPTAAAPSFFS